MSPITSIHDLVCLPPTTYVQDFSSSILNQCNVPAQVYSMMRARSMDCKGSCTIDVVKRAKSAPPSIHIDMHRGRRNFNVYFGRAGCPPAKAPPPVPTSDYRFRYLAEHVTRMVVPVMLEISGKPFLITDSSGNENPMSLSVDFMHTVGDVERAIQYHTTCRVRLCSPMSVVQSDKVMTLCVAQVVRKLSVVKLHHDGTYLI
jgi:hypothetical protein